MRLLTGPGVVRNRFEGMKIDGAGFSKCEFSLLSYMHKVLGARISTEKWSLDGGLGR